MNTQITGKLATSRGTIRIVERKISAESYIEFLTRTDLGSQYPRERFFERIEKLVANTQISLLALNEAGLVVGACFGLTDFAYWLMVTDLGIDRAYARNGIGSRMIKMARAAAGGEKDIIVFINANQKAVPFYEKNGLKRSQGMMELAKVEWTDFTVNIDTVSEYKKMKG